MLHTSQRDLHQTGPCQGVIETKICLAAKIWQQEKTMGLFSSSSLTKILVCVNFLKSVNDTWLMSMGCGFAVRHARPCCFCGIVEEKSSNANRNTKSNKLCVSINVVPSYLCFSLMTPRLAHQRSGTKAKGLKRVNRLSSWSQTCPRGYSLEHGYVRLPQS